MTPIADSDRLAFIYMIDPPGLLSIAAPLLLSIRRHHPHARIFPYCPMGRRLDVPEQILRFHADHDAPVVELTRPLPFAQRGKDRPYRHGNKLLAVAERRETEYCVFVDTDTYLARPLDDPRLFQPDTVAAVPESVASYAGSRMQIWDRTYAVFGMQTPAERVTMLRTRKRQPPYFNAGFVAFPEVTPTGARFGEMWLDTAVTLDFDETTDHQHKRPWLDQAAMPIAILRAGCRHEAMERWFNYPLDTPSFLPDPEVRLYHYHSLARLEATGHFSEIEDLVDKSGYFRSLEHFLEPLRTAKGRQGKLWSQLFKGANERRRISRQIKALDSKAEQRPLKDELRRLKRIDTEMRERKTAILEEQFYDPDWMVRRQAP